MYAGYFAYFVLVFCLYWVACLATRLLTALLLSVLPLQPFPTGAACCCIVSYWVACCCVVSYWVACCCVVSYWVACCCVVSYWVACCCVVSYWVACCCVVSYWVACCCVVSYWSRLLLCRFLLEPLAAFFPKHSRTNSFVGQKIYRCSALFRPSICIGIPFIRL